jgi:uroporphyrinogen-III synthase
MPLAFAIPDGAHDCIAITSQNAMRHAGAALAPFSHLPVFAVGARTAQSAQARGFNLAGEAETAAALAPLIAASGAKRVLYPCGVVRRPDLEKALERAAIACAAVPVYDAIVIAGAADTLGTLLAEAPDAGILLHAPSAATALALTLAHLAESNRLGSVTFFCLSDAVCDALPVALRGQARVALRPDEDSLLALLQ